MHMGTSLSCRVYHSYAASVNIKLLYFVSKVLIAEKS